jgi:hypothetical protein
MLQRTQLHADWPVETVIAMGRSPWGGVANAEMIRRVMEEPAAIWPGDATLPSPAANSSGCSWPAVWRSCGAMAPRGLAVSR